MIGDERYKALMEQCGMPNSMSVYQAMKQLENEVWHQANARISAAEKERGDAYRLAEKYNLECDEYKTDNERLAKERDEALAWGEKLKEHLKGCTEYRIGHPFYESLTQLSAPASLSHLRQEIRRETMEEVEKRFENHFLYKGAAEELRRLAEEQEGKK